MCEERAGSVGVVVGFFPTHLFSFVHTPLAFGEGCEEYIAHTLMWCGNLYVLNLQRTLT